MTINENVDPMPLLKSLFCALLSKKGFLKKEDYEFRLGYKVINKMVSLLVPELNWEIGEKGNEEPMLFGIKVHVDFVNPWNVQLYQDITREV